jgi:peptide/nickel transport system permease protein
MTQIRQFLPYTVQLALAGVFIASLVGIPLGIVSAVRRNSWIDHICRVLSMVGVSMPHFWFGLVLMWIFALQLRWAPFSGGGELDDVQSLLRHLALPAVVVGFGSAALVTRMTRSCMLEVLGQDYVRTARAKGLAERVVIAVHSLKNALIPVITVIGLQIGAQLGGVLTVEVVFARPGLGKLMFDSLDLNDYAQAQACMLTFALIIIVVNILTDIAYAYADPRVRLE